MTAVLLGFCAAAILAWAITGKVRQYALHQAVLDVPNHRSLHAVPTPRGGGVAVAAVALVGTVAGWAAGAVEPRLALALVGGGAAIAWVGWRDDRGHVPARWRAAVHLLAAVFACGLLGGMPALRLGDAELRLGYAGYPLAILAIMWMVNLYNFMDGIDGLAGSQAVVAGCGGGLLALLAGKPGVALPAFLIGGAAAGFLIWNWSPARIFMGDVGSGLLGYLFAVLALGSERAGALPVSGWLLLLGVFVFDATVTLARRVARGEKWYDAHRSHAYQRAVQAGFAHSRIAAGATALNLLLAAGAALTVWQPRAAWLVVAASVLLLTGAYLWVERRRPM